MRTHRLFAVLLALTIAAGPAARPALASATMRDDDGVREDSVHVNNGSDVARKMLLLPTDVLQQATDATLWVYAAADACVTSSPAHRLTANGTAVADFDPCDKWTANAYSWAGFDIPLSALIAGTLNDFDIAEIGGLAGDLAGDELQIHEGDPAHRNAFYGVDTTTDFGRSEIFDAQDYYTGYGTPIPGELMWYLTVTNPAQSSDTARPACWISGGFANSSVHTTNANGVCTDDSGIDVVTVVFRDASSYSRVTAALTCTGNATWCVWHSSAGVPGYYTVTVTATDGAGNNSAPAEATGVWIS